MRIFIPFVIGICAWGQSGLDRPRLGSMLDRSGVVRAVYGIAGSVTSGDPEGIGVVAIACSRRLCLAKIDSALVSSSGAIPSPKGAAVFALDGDAALVYFPQSRQLARWHDGLLDPMDFTLEGNVLAMRTVGGVLEFAIRGIHGVSIVQGDGVVVASLPCTNGPVALLDDGVLYYSPVRQRAVSPQQPTHVVLRRTNGTEFRFGVSGVEAFFQLGDGYIQVRAGASNYLLRTDPGKEQIFLLPEATQ